MTAPCYRATLMLLVLAVFLVWTYVLVHSICCETRAAVYSEIMLDNNGVPQNVIWEIGKGYRLPTPEETEDGKRN